MVSGIVGVGLALLLIHTLNARLRPIMVDLAEAKINNEVTQLLSLAVEQLPMDYGEAVTLEKDGEGRITALTSNMGAIGSYRARLTQRLVEALDEMKKEALSIPLGSATGFDLLSGRGPGIPVKVLSVGAVNSRFENVFTSAGINQTRHQIMLKLTVTVSILLPGSTSQTDVECEVCAAETVIVGSVPENYTYFSQFDNAKDAADHYFDYGAGQ